MIEKIGNSIRNANFTKNTVQPSEVDFLTASKNGSGIGAPTGQPSYHYLRIAGRDGDIRTISRSDWKAEYFDSAGNNRVVDDVPAHEMYGADHSKKLLKIMEENKISSLDELEKLMSAGRRSQDPEVKKTFMKVYTQIADIMKFDNDEELKNNLEAKKIDRFDYYTKPLMASPGFSELETWREKNRISYEFKKAWHRILMLAEHMAVFDKVNTETKKTPHGLSWAEAETLFETEDRPYAKPVPRREYLTSWIPPSPEDMKRIGPVQRKDITERTPDMVSYKIPSSGETKKEMRKDWLLKEWELEREKKTAVPEGHKELDKNNDGVVDQMEWDEPFTQWDTNKDNKLSPKEGARLCAAYRHLSPELRDEILKGMTGEAYWGHFSDHAQKVIQDDPRPRPAPGFSIASPETLVWSAKPVAYYGILATAENFDNEALKAKGLTPLFGV